MKRILFLAGYAVDSFSITQIISKHRILKEFISPEKVRDRAQILYLCYILTINSILFLYALIHNFCFKVCKKKDIFYLLIVSFWPLYSILSSNRLDLLFLMAIFIYLLYFFFNMKNGKPVMVRRRIFKLGSKLLIVFFIFFILLTIFMGRRNTFADIHVQDYLTKYISAGIRNFDLFVKEPHDTDGWGKETFPSIYRFIYTHFGYGEYYKVPLEFRKIKGISLGNIYTGFRRYYSDFGVFGLMVIPFILGLLMNSLYYKAKKLCKNNMLGFEILLFAYLSRCLFLMPIEDQFFIFEFSARGLFKILVLYILYCLFIKKKMVFIHRIKNV